MEFIFLAFLAILAACSLVRRLSRWLRPKVGLPDPSSLPPVVQAVNEAFACLLASALLPLFIPAGLYWIEFVLLPNETDNRLSGPFVLMIGLPLLVASAVFWWRGVTWLYRFHRLRPQGIRKFRETASYALAMLYVLMVVAFLARVVTVFS